MAKPMLVTLPCVLLLLDYWPLGRLGPSWSDFRQKGSKLLLEKAPLFALAVPSGLLAIHAQQLLGALPSLQQISLDTRLGNALTSFVAYLGKMVWPTDLAVFYPHPVASLPLGQVILAILVIGTLTLLVLRGAASYPYLLVGWLWYLGTLLPVSGLIQVGQHSMADRYMYVPLIGVFILLVWGCTQWVDGSQLKKGWGIGATVLLLLGLSINTRLQLAHWQNSMTLFEHAIQSTEDNYLAHNNLGTVFLEAGEIDKGMEQLSIALEIKPESPGVLYNLGLALKQKGHLDEAARLFLRSLGHQPEPCRCPQQPGDHTNGTGRWGEGLPTLFQGSGDGSATLRSPQQSGDTLVGKWAGRESHLVFFPNPSSSIPINPGLTTI